MSAIEAIRADLIKHGYQEVDDHKHLSVGDRIRHRNELYREAQIHGTGIIRAIFEKPDSAWSRAWHMPDVEMAVEFDRGTHTWGDPSRMVQLAQYHVAIPDGPLLPDQPCWCKWCRA